MHNKKRQELIRQISNIISSLTIEEKQEITKQTQRTKQISDIINSLTLEEKQKIKQEILKEKGIPISVFKGNLSGLEIITKYLKEEENKSFKQISKILNRKLSTLYNTYNKSKIKFKTSLDTSDNSIVIPFDIFTNRKYSILESIVSYLRHNQLSIAQISLLLNRNYNTIKTVHHRFKLKNERN